MGDFYESHPYPPPVDDLDAYRRAWNDARRRAEYRLFFPHAPYRDDFRILVAGCGTAQAARYAVRWPNAAITGIDLSATSIQATQTLKRKYALDHLVLRQMPLERAAELGTAFDYVACTGVLHHLPDPAAGLRALRDVLAPDGTMHLMVYARYGRTGVYMLAEYCRRLGVGTSPGDVAGLAAALQALPADHPIGTLLRKSPDFRTPAGLADALLHPCDRAYSVPEFLALLAGENLALARWVRQAPYLACGALARTPHAQRLASLDPGDRYAAAELFRGTMVRHSAAVAHAAAVRPVRFDGDAWRAYVPIALPETAVVRERLPAGAAAVLINRNHTDTDLVLPVSRAQLQLYQAIDGTRTIAALAAAATMAEADARSFFETLWEWDQALFDASRA